MRQSNTKLSPWLSLHRKQPGWWFLVCVQQVPGRMHQCSSGLINFKWPHCVFFVAFELCFVCLFVYKQIYDYITSAFSYLLNGIFPTMLLFLFCLYFFYSSFSSSQMTQEFSNCASLRHKRTGGQKHVLEIHSLMGSRDALYLTWRAGLDLFWIYWAVLMWLFTIDLERTSRGISLSV